MVTRVLFYALILVAACFIAQAQGDTVILDQVEVTSFANKTSDLDSLVYGLVSGQSLGEALQASTGIYLRQYGAEGQLTSVSFRGTTPSQTQVSWKGVDINSQTLGQSDFSSIPLFLFEGITIHHGAASTLYGSGAIGGVVELNNARDFIGFEGEVNQQIGSYGKVFTGLRAGYGSQEWGVRVAGVRNKIDNDFPVSFRGETYKQNNAASLTKVVLAEAYTRFENHKITASVWYNEHDRDSQPIIGFLNAQDHLLDRNLRTNLAFESALNAGYLALNLAYIDDRQTFNTNSNTNLKRYIASGEYQFLAFRKWQIRTGGKFGYAVPDVSSYEDDISQLRSDLFVLSKWNPTNKLSIAADLRLPYQEFQNKVPLVPSLSTEYAFMRGEVNLSGSVRSARSFRFPTLNDLYWNPGGNKDLVAEDGLTLETIWRVSGVKKGLSFAADLSGYITHLSNMIVWQPSGSYWSPHNVQSVRVLGTEVTGELAQKISQWHWKLNGTYSYNSSQNTELDTQLPYVPYHKGSLYAGLGWRTWSVSYLESYTGKRFTETTNTSVLEAFSVAQVQLGKDFRFASHTLKLAAQVRNFWDTQYQNYELRATPGRHYLFQINYQLTN